MAIPGVSSAAAAAAAGDEVEKQTKTKTSSAANDRRVKLQHFLVMKAFNLRKDDKQTVNQQFQFLKRLDDNQSGRAYVDLGQLCEYLSIPPFRRLVLFQVFQLAPSDTRLDFDVFVRFLQSTAVQAAEEERELQRNYSSCSLPTPPTSRTLNRSAGQLEESGDSSQVVCFQATWLSSQTRFSHPPPAPGLWKKREITIQERITEYTKIDEHGRPQHLIEKEKHQSEVIHMENLAGEFAHREITHFEQTEQLNDEIVHHEHGREEFVHLKSEHDEVSRFESSIPTGGGGASRPEECEQPPPSPTIKRDPSVVGGEDDRERRSFGGSHGFDNDTLDPEAMGMTEEEFYQYQSQLDAAAADEHHQQQEQQQFEMESIQ